MREFHICWFDIHKPPQSKNVMFTECDILRFMYDIYFKNNHAKHRGILRYICFFLLLHKYIKIVLFFCVCFILLGWARLTRSLLGSFASFVAEISVWKLSKDRVFFDTQFIANFVKIMFLEQMCLLSPIFDYLVELNWKTNTYVIWKSSGRWIEKKLHQNWFYLSRISLNGHTGDIFYVPTCRSNIWVFVCPTKIETLFSNS